MLDVNKKILWLADYEIENAPGGAQISDKMLIEQGKILGYNILKLTAFSLTDNLNIHDYDILITSNIHSILLNRNDLLDEIAKHKHHIRIEHDSNEYLTQNARIKLFSNCCKTIFLTEFHYSYFKQFYGDIFKNVEIIYDPIDCSKFKNLNNLREDKILYSGFIHPLKGAYEFFEFAIKNKNQKFVIAGWSHNHVLHHLCTSIDNIEYLGLINHENMPDIYNKYKYMYYEPSINEPFCRSVAEAVLCGMQIITHSTNKIGSLTEIYKNGIEKFREDCSKAKSKFWSVL